MNIDTSYAKATPQKKLSIHKNGAAGAIIGGGAYAVGKGIQTYSLCKTNGGFKKALESIGKTKSKFFSGAIFTLLACASIGGGLCTTIAKFTSKKDNENLETQT